MKKTDISAWVIVICMMISAAVSVAFMSSEIEVQWNDNGVSSVTSKWIVFVFPALAALCIVLHKTQGSKEHGDGSRAYFIGILIALAAEILIICNALDLIHITRIDGSFAVKIAGLCIGCLLMYFGNKLPKTARNYYIGVKTPAAFNNDNVWTLTQRFAGKVWVSVGLIFVFLSFAPAAVQSAVMVVGMIAIVILPRIYSKYVFSKNERN